MGRLMKYDLRAALRLFVPMWLGLLALSIVNRFTFAAGGDVGSDSRFTAGIFLLVYTLAVMGVAITAFIYVVQRFYQSLVKDEAYLTFTLPVSVDSILWSKALMGLVLMVITGIVCVASLLIIVVVMEWKHLALVIEHQLSDQIVQLIALYGAAFLVSCLAEFFLVFLSIGIGQLCQRHRFAGAVGAFVGINMLMSVGSLAMAPIFAELQERFNYLAVLERMEETSVALFLIIPASLIQGAIYYFPARWLFKKKLNLE